MLQVHTLLSFPGGMGMLVNCHPWSNWCPACVAQRGDSPLLHGGALTEITLPFSGSQTTPRIGVDTILGGFSRSKASPATGAHTQ